VKLNVTQEKAALVACDTACNGTWPGGREYHVKGCPNDPARAALIAWTVPVEHRPACPLSQKPCPSWTCLVDVCTDGSDVPPGYGTPEAQRISAMVDRDLMREVLEAVCVRDGFSLESSVNPGEPARNYELALRLGIGHVFGLTQGESDV
jgi:hypothetical protein